MKDFSEDFFDEEKIRQVPRTELQRQKNYQELLPRPSDEEYQLLKKSIARDGLHPGHPILVNDDQVVLDGYTRLQIAGELDKEWVWVQTLEFEDHYAEKLFIIESNLVRRQLTTGQRAAAALKFLDIEKEMARDRQRQAGELYGKSHPKQDQESSSKLPLNSGEALGEAMKLLASQFKVGHDSLYRAQKIEQAAQSDPEVAEAWDQVKQGEGTVNQVYQQVQEKAGVKRKAKKKPKFDEAAEQEAYRELTKKTYFEKMTERLPDTEPFPDDELLRALHHVAKLKGIPVEAIDGAIELQKSLDYNGESLIMAWFRWWSQDLFDADTAWNFTMEWVELWQKQQRAARPEEVPVPDDTHKLGPWALDFVHQAGLEDLVRDFPAESAHLIYSDAVADVEQVGLLGELAARVLTEGKYLCVYVDKRQLPESMSRLSAAGLTYFWSCAVFRPDDKVEVQEMLVREKWRLLLLYRKGEASGAGWDWFEDAVENRRPSNREMVRQLVKGLTASGQLVVDPLVGSGITGQVTRSMGRRFLCFGAEEADVRAANQRISQVRLAEESAT